MLDKQRHDRLNLPGTQSQNFAVESVIASQPSFTGNYSNAITAKGTPLDNCFGFIGGTVRPLISKPGQNQCVVYNGHKRVHGVKFQSVALPNGIIEKKKFVIFRPVHRSSRP